MAQPIQAKVTISRPITNTEEEYISLSIVDSSSNIEFVRLKLTLSDFAKALTGNAFVQAQGHVAGLDKIGKKHEHKKEIVSFHIQGEHQFSRNIEFDSPVWEKGIAPFEVDGWKADQYLGSQDSFVDSYKDLVTRTVVVRYRVTFRRYVDVE